jgi:hypothetical protein
VRPEDLASGDGGFQVAERQLSAHGSRLDATFLDPGQSAKRIRISRIGFPLEAHPHHLFQADVVPLRVFAVTLICTSIHVGVHIETSA